MCAGITRILAIEILDPSWALSASGRMISLFCPQSLNGNYLLARSKEQKKILFQILKSYWNDSLWYIQEIKINEWGDQIVPIPIQRKNCIENVCLRKEIPVNSAESQEFVQPLPYPLNPHMNRFEQPFILTASNFGSLNYLDLNDKKTSYAGDSHGAKSVVAILNYSASQGRFWQNTIIISVL